MRIKPDTDFLVKPGEVITVTVLASGTVYLAAISDLSFGNWIPVSPPNPEVRKFIVSDVPTNSFDIAFAFEPAADPAKYHVTIVGDPNEDTYSKDIPPDPPLPTGRDYTLVTS
jgi:hypothetical protein